MGIDSLWNVLDDLGSEFVPGYDSFKKIGKTVIKAANIIGNVVDGNGNLSEKNIKFSTSEPPRTWRRPPSGQTPPPAVGRGVIPPSHHQPINTLTQAIRGHGIPTSSISSNPPVPKHSVSFHNLNISGIWSPPSQFGPWGQPVPNPEKNFIQQYGPIIYLASEMFNQRTGYAQGIMVPNTYTTMLYLQGMINNIPALIHLQLHTNYALVGSITRFIPSGNPWMGPRMVGQQVSLQRVG